MPPTELFDYCVVWSAMNIDTIIKEQNDTDSEFCEIPCKFVMDETLRQKYVASLADEEAIHLLQNFVNDVENCDINIDTLSEKSINIIHLAAFKSSTFKRLRCIKRKKKNKSKWFNGNLYYMKRELRRLGKKLQMNSDNLNLNMLFTA